MRAVVAPVALARGTGTVPRRLGSVPAGNGRVIPTARRAPRPYYNQRAQGTSLVVAQSSNTVAVTFTLARKVNFGQSLALVGNAEQLGAWNLEHAPTMTWGEGDVWTSTLELPAGADVEYKFALVDPHNPPIWESCANRNFVVPSATVVTCAWDEPGATTCESVGDNDGAADGIAPAFRPAQVLASYDAGSNGKAAYSNGNSANYSPEQLDFLRRTGKLGGSAAAPSRASLRPSSRTPSPAARASPAPAAAAGLSAEQRAFLERSGKSASPAPAVALRPSSRTPSPRATSPAARGSPAPASASGQQYTPEQLEFLRRKSSSPVPAARTAAPVRAASPAAHTNGQLSAEQRAFLERSGKSASPAPQVALRPSSRTPSPRAASPAARGSAAPAAPNGAQYTPEQLEFMRRTGKLNGASSSPQPAAAAARGGGGAGANYSPEQLEFLRRTGKL